MNYPTSHELPLTSSHPWSPPLHWNLRIFGLDLDSFGHLVWSTAIIEAGAMDGALEE